MIGLVAQCATRQPIHFRICTASQRLAPIDEIRPRLAGGILESPGNDERSAFRQQQS